MLESLIAELDGPDPVSGRTVVLSLEMFERDVQYVLDEYLAGRIARYVPPLGAVGRVIDRAIMSRVAEATLKDFLDGVHDALLREARDRTPVKESTAPHG